MHQQPDFTGLRKKLIDQLSNGLSKKLSYHDLRHTQDVEQVAEAIAREMRVPEEDVRLLRTAALLHDSGFLNVYKDHEEHGCEIALEMLPAYGYRVEDIEAISGMIMATKIPQNPKTKLERILADADLDYLGRNDYEPISETLYQEMRTYGFLETREEWLRIQINFLRNHHYHTEWSKEHRAPQKAKVLEQLESQLSE